MARKIGSACNIVGLEQGTINNFDSPKFQKTIYIKKTFKVISL